VEEAQNIRQVVQGFTLLVTTGNPTACQKLQKRARFLWLTPIILATHEAEMKRMVVGSQLGK
jgi:hypothetical protein